MERVRSRHEVAFVSCNVRSASNPTSSKLDLGFGLLISEGWSELLLLEFLLLG